MVIHLKHLPYSYSVLSSSYESLLYTRYLTCPTIATAYISGRELAKEGLLSYRGTTDRSPASAGLPSCLEARGQGRGLWKEGLACPWLVLMGKFELLTTHRRSLLGYTTSLWSFGARLHHKQAGGASLSYHIWTAGVLLKCWLKQVSNQYSTCGSQVKRKISPYSTT